uniref:Zinc finger and BTB domain containing 22b n=1 Tax=Cynoglossus semilaevis TaxID=244447 RepID=A0A3P8WQU1_CYNSE
MFRFFFFFFHVCFPSAQASVLDSLNRQREDGRLCDLAIHVQGQVFKAHRCVLAASSPYFHDQVLLKNMSTVSIPAVMDPLAFESVLSCAYTGQLRMLREDIVNYLTVGSVLQMWHIVDKCTELLKEGRVVSGVGNTEESGSEMEFFLDGEESVMPLPRRPTYSQPSIMPRKQWVVVKTERPEDDDLIVVSGEEGEGYEEDEDEVELDKGTAAPPLGVAGGIMGAAAFKGHGLEHGAVHLSVPNGLGLDGMEGSGGNAGGSGGTVSSGGSGKVFMCHCGKTFTHKSMRDRHINMHLDLRPFNCPVCAKKFKMKHHLTEHMKTHTGLKPYDCSGCGKKFMWRDSFMRHRSNFCHQTTKTTREYKTREPVGLNVEKLAF